jgi:stress response protein YsnF
MINRKYIDMSDRFTSQTGLPVVDFFFNGYSTMLDMQRKAFDLGRMLPSPMNMNLARTQKSGDREVAIGATEQQVIPITKEELRIGKRQVQSAKAYRVSATVVEVPVEQQVNLRAETVVIERRPTRGTTVRGGQSFRDHTIEVHEMYEEPVVGKVVTQAEELVIYKTLSERTATVRETVRETRVNVEEQKAPARPRAEIKAELEGAFQIAADDKPRELAAIKNHVERKDHNEGDKPSADSTNGRRQR